MYNCIFVCNQIYLAVNEIKTMDIHMGRSSQPQQDVAAGCDFVYLDQLLNKISSILKRYVSLQDSALV